MVLTPEQVERIRRNRERALELQRTRRRLEEEEEEGRNNSKRKQQAEEGERGRGDADLEQSKRPKKEQEAARKQEEEEANVELEAFEEGASEYVTKQEAAKMYCLPEGTLAVCEVVEKPNPRNALWKPMKLYRRAEVRRRARARFGGLQGLVSERRNREERRLAKDLERTRNVFASSR